ncbi:uncharacterized protein LOC135961183 [Calliphora vicina]|uniref:uncharacterized protein LOC135961183 n=1 Tax=Calliphora vicina TaxID=7373 RepID=UPI00325A8A95
MQASKRNGKPSRLEALCQQKNTVLNNIDRVRRSIREKTISFNPIELECRLDILNSYIEQAMTYQSEIDILDPENEDRSAVEDLCVSTKCLLLGYLTPSRKQSMLDTTIGCSTHHSSLPKMKLPKFSGKYSEYKNFISLFESLVDHDMSLTDIEKFNHLISCLSDEALGTVKAFQVTEQNYSKALASLKRVYDNPCLIFYDNIRQLFHLQEITKPSSSALRSMIDTVSAIYDSLLSIGDDKAITNAIIIHLVMTKVDPITRTKWEEQLNYEKLPLWSDCEEALNRRYQHISAEEASGSRPQSNKNTQKKNENNSGRKGKSFSCQANAQQDNIKCIFCRSVEHYVSNCPSFSAIPVQQRFDFVKGVPACINCLRKGHTVTRCKASKCRVCNRSHHTLLHQYAATNVQSLDMASSSPDQPPSASVNISSSNRDNVILATALVKIKDRSGQYVFARALLDSGSQINFVTEELSQRLQLKKEENNLSLVGVGKTNSAAKFKIQATVKSRVNSHEFSSDFWVLRSISGYQPDKVISTSGWNIPDNIELADPYFFKPQKIDMLIGAEIFFELLCIGQIRRSPDIPTVQKTLLGWVVSGKYKNCKTSTNESCHISTYDIDETETSLDRIVQRFWELEEIPKERNILPIEHQQCEEKFIESVRQLPSGKFEVSLPFKGDPRNLGCSFDVVKRRFLSLERRLSKDVKMKEMYNNFMKEYIELGHMTITDNKIPDSPHYFIPHQCVLRPQSISTKLRVVFDASCRTTTHLSLNDLLMIGPTVQEELYSTLIRFRLHKYAVTADIEKMYRQVLIDEADRKFQLILWRES